VTIEAHKEMDIKKLALALLAIAESLPRDEQDRLAAEGAAIAEKFKLYPRPVKRAKRSEGSAA